MKQDKLIELSHRLTPGKEEFELAIETMNIEEVHKTTVRRSDIWYIIQRITLSSHVGTHIEFPFHHLRTGKSAADYPLSRLVGEAVLFNFTHKRKMKKLPGRKSRLRASKFWPETLLSFTRECRNSGILRGHTTGRCFLLRPQDILLSIKVFMLSVRMLPAWK